MEHETLHTVETRAALIRDSRCMVDERCEKIPEMKRYAALDCFNRGNAHKGENRLDEAIAWYQRAVSLRPAYAEAYNNMGLVFQEKGDLDQSIHCFQKAIEHKPRLFQAYFNMGVSYQSRQDEANAIFCFQKALLLKPDLSVAYNRLGAIFRNKGELDKAVFCFQKEIEIDPQNAQAHNNLGSAFHDMGKVAEAIACFQKSLSLRPDHVETHWNLALAQLLTGNYIDGWRGYEYRFRRSSHRPTLLERHHMPRWDGSSFEGKRLLVQEEQGLGDNLQFVRYMPMVKARGGTVLFRTDKPLLSLFQGIGGIDEIGEWPSGAVPDLDVDLYVPMMSLPWIFGTTLETIPSHVPYIRPDQRKVEAWASRIDGKGLKVGLVWAGRPTAPTEPVYVRGRSCDLMHFLPLSRITGISLYGLQKGEVAKHAENCLESDVHITNLGEAFEDFSDTAAAMAQLDLIISIDTSVAHLSGAMGKPTWLLLQSVSDFRWLQHREDNPWYPTMRLFRQARPGDWTGVFDRVCAELTSLMATTVSGIR